MLLTSKLTLFLSWRIEGTMPKDLRKFVIAAGTHTSNWDYILMLGVTARLGLRPRVLIKREAFFPPLGMFLRFFGGIPVNRAEPQTLVADLLEDIGAAEEFVLIVTPEGTRTSDGSLKSGFFRIAREAGLSIVPATVHAERKLVKIHAPIAAEDKTAVFERISRLFASSTGLRN